LAYAKESKTVHHSAAAKIGHPTVSDYYRLVHYRSCSDYSCQIGCCRDTRPIWRCLWRKHASFQKQKSEIVEVQVPLWWYNLCTMHRVNKSKQPVERLDNMLANKIASMQADNIRLIQAEKNIKLLAKRLGIKLI